MNCPDVAIKKITECDSERFWDLLENNRRYLERWMPRIRENFSVETNKKIINLFIEEMRAGDSIRGMVYFKSEPVGYVGAKVHKLNRNCDISYWISERFSGMGITRKAVGLIMEEVFVELDLNKLYISSSAKNYASIAIAKSLGFVLEGTLREHELLLDGYHDILLFAILRRDWEKSR